MDGTRFEIERPEGDERGVLVRCPEHGESVEFQPGERGGAFYCSGCALEVEVRVHPPDWRDLGERC